MSPGHVRWHFQRLATLMVLVWGAIDHNQITVLAGIGLAILDLGAEERS